MVDPFRLAFDVWKDVRPPLARYLAQVDLEATDELLADRSGAATPRVMVFGAYNAGKSTLINALVGEEVAPVADHPKTAFVSSYPWRGFMLDDTPGLDAPIEHEQVTRAHLETADVVLFVLATDGTLEEQRTYDEIVAIVRSERPIRIILNNKTGLAAGDRTLFDLYDKVTDNMKKAAAAAGFQDIETRVPIRAVNAYRGFQGRQQGKPGLFAASGLPELEAELVELCSATGKGDMARTVCRRIVRQVDLVLAGFGVDDEALQIRDAADRITAERMRLEAVLLHAAQETAAEFQGDLRRAVDTQSSEGIEAASCKAGSSMASKIAHELRTTQRVFEMIGHDLGDAPQEGAPSNVKFHIPPQEKDKNINNSADLQNSANIISSILAVKVSHEVMVGGFMAAKQMFPSLLKGLGPKFAGRMVPLIGPTIQAAVGVFDSIKAYRQENRDFEREKARRLGLEQQISDAGRSMRLALQSEVETVIEQCFSSVETALATQIREMQTEAAALEADRAALLRCKGRLEIALDCESAPK